MGIRTLAYAIAVLSVAGNCLPAVASDQTVAPPARQSEPDVKQSEKDSSDQDAEPKSGRRRFRIGGIMIGAGYSHYSGYPGWRYPYWSPGYWSPWYWSAYSFYDPWFYGPFFHPGYFTGFARGMNMGEIKLRNSPKDAAVFLDGAYAGTADKLKTMWLEPGAYNLELRTAGSSFSKRVYVLSGKTLAIVPEFSRLTDKEQQQ